MSGAPDHPQIRFCAALRLSLFMLSYEPGLPRTSSPAPASGPSSDLPRALRGGRWRSHRALVIAPSPAERARMHAWAAVSSVGAGGDEAGGGTRVRVDGGSGRRRRRGGYSTRS